MHADLTTALAIADSLLSRDSRLALEQAREILRAVPGHPHALLILGTAQRLSGDYPAAVATLSALAVAEPMAAGVFAELALAQAESGDLPAAITSQRRALALKPGMAGGWRQLADFYRVGEQTAFAAAAYARHVQEAVHDPELMQAGAALSSNDLPLADRLLRARLAQQPTDVAALRMLGELATRIGRDADAENLLTQTLALLPGFTLARHNLAVVLNRQNKASEAIPHLENLLAAEPDNPNYQSLYAACLAMVAEYDRAITVYRALVARHPHQPKIWLSYGHALRTAGHRAAAIESYRKAASQRPQFGEAWWSLANLKTESFSNTDIAKMHAALTAPASDVDDRLHLYYALGRAYEQARDFARSWQHYAQGAALRRGELQYNASHTSAKMQAARAMLTREFFDARAGVGCSDEAPIFIVGLPRSGSTLIEQILASHSQVEGTLELPDMPNLVRALGGHEKDAYPECLADLPFEQFAVLGRHYLDRTRIYRKTDRPVFIDKLPNNFVHTGLIHLILPRAKIIDARRHPMAACFSAFKQHFAKGQHYSYDLVELGQYYRDYLDLMAHFDEVLPGRVHRVQYEDVVESLAKQAASLLHHCGLPFEPACLVPHENKRAVRTASSEQVRQPIYREGLDHWRHYEAWLAPLAALLRI